MYKQKSFNNPINSARFQNFYSFTRTERFLDKNKLNCDQTYYDSKFIGNGRTTSLGKGQRMSWVNKNNIVPPGKYELRGQFEAERSRSKGSSFPLTPRGQLFPQEINKVTPGPVKYTSPNYDTIGLSFTMGPQLKIKQEVLPGLDPGQYEPIEAISSKGNYFLSRFGNSKCVRVLKCQRFNYEYEETPGPATYRKIKQTKRAKSFCKSPRFDQPKLTVGPGQYYTYSQF